MKLEFIKNIYKINHIESLKTLNDLTKCHGIILEDITGYSRLSIDQKETLKSFVLNYYNDLNLEVRSEIVPKQVYLAKEVEYLKKDANSNALVLLDSELWDTTEPTNNILIKTSTYLSNKTDSILQRELSPYLRFEYEYNGDLEWLHIYDNGHSWE